MRTRATGSLASALALLLAGPAAAQVVFDGSIGPSPAGTTLDTTPTLWPITDDLGAYKGTNLFFSLTKIDVPGGKVASFQPQTNTNPVTSNVVVRVTGGKTTVDGTIQSLFNFSDTVGANLYLLNPNGFMLTSNSSVLSKGSAYVSTAPQLRFPGGVTLDTGSTEPPVLSSDPPSAFGFLGGSDAADVSIQATSTNYRNSVAPGGTFAVVAGDVTLAEGSSAGTVGNNGADTVLVGVGSSAASVPAADPAAFSVHDAADPAALGTVDVTGAVTVQSPGSTSAGPAGQVVIRGGHLVVENGASLSVVSSSSTAGAATAIDLEASQDLVVRDAKTSLSSSVSSGVKGGDVHLAAPSIEVSGGALVSSTQAGNSNGTAPEIRVDGGDVSVKSGGQIVSNSLRAGDGGRISIAASNLAVDGGEIRSNATNAGAGGDIAIVADAEVDVTNQGRIASQTTRTGPGGDVDVTAGSRIFVESPAEFDGDASQISAITNSTSTSAIGGDVTLRAPLIELRQGGQVRTSTLQAARGGDLSVLETGALVIDGTAQQAGNPDATSSGLFARAEPFNDTTPLTGSAGDLHVEADTVDLTNGGAISSSSFGSGAAGHLSIQADRVTAQGSADAVSLISTRGRIGPGGDLEIDTPLLQLVDGGVASSTTLGAGKAGDLTVRANVVEISGTNAAGASGLFAQTRGGSGAGDGGTLRVEVGERLTVTNGGKIATESSQGNGFAGDVEIVGAPLVQVTDGGVISASVFDTRPANPGDEASVILSDIGRVELDAGTIEASTGGSGPGGNIDIAAVDEVDLEHGSLISARSESGNAFDAGDAGSIRIDGGKRLIVRDSTIETLAVASGGGQVALTADDVVYFENSLVNTLVATGGGNGGNIDIPFPEDPPAPVLAVAADTPPQTPPRFAVLNHSSLVATAIDGNGGNITVSAGNFLVSSDSRIDASSQKGIDGLVQTTTPDAQLAGQITPLPTNYFDASQLMKTPCAARTARTGSFVVQTRAALEPPPDAPLSAGAASEPGKGPSSAGNCPI